MSKEAKKTEAKSKPKPVYRPVGWGIDQTKYDQARKPHGPGKD